MFLIILTGIMAYGAVALFVRWVLGECASLPVLRLSEKVLKLAPAPSVPSRTGENRAESAWPLKRADEAVDLLKRGCPCSRAILVAYGPSLGISRGEAIELGLDLPKRLDLTETCSAVTGSFVVLAKHCARQNGARAKPNGKVNAAIREFTEQFEARHGSVLCRQLLDRETGQRKAGKPPVRPGPASEDCPKLVHGAAEILEGMLN